MTFIYIYLGALFAVMISGLYFVERNHWVYRQRSRLIDEFYFQQKSVIEAGGVVEHDELRWDSEWLSYSEMLYNRFWVWDIQKLRKRPKKNV